jgi:hypothetical protein
LHTHKYYQIEKTQGMPDNPPAITRVLLSYIDPCGFLAIVGGLHLPFSKNSNSSLKVVLS